MESRGVFVTGATGFIGQHLVNRLLEEGQGMWKLTRNPDKIPFQWKDKLAILRADLSDSGLSLPKETKVVFHCAGEIRDKVKLKSTNTEGARNIVRACLEHKGCKLVHLSSVGVMGAKRDMVVNEGRGCFPKNMYEKTKYEAEKIIQDAVRDLGLNAVILRPSIVYGPGITEGRDSFLALIRAIQKRRFCLIGKKPSYYNIIYVGDVVEALLFLASNPAAGEKKVFIINDVMKWGEFVNYVQSLLHVEHKIGTIPQALAFCLALGSELGHIFGVKPPFSISRFKALSSKTIFSSERIKSELNFKFLFGNAKGLRNTIDYYRQRQLL